MTSERMRATYEAIAADYAAHTFGMTDDLAEYGRKFVEYLPARARVLDIGCGAGRDMEWLEAQRLDVTGLDLSPGMLRQARSRVRGQLIEGDMLRLGLPESHFHGVWCNAALLHLQKTDVPLALCEIRNVLVPRGVAALRVQKGAGEGWEQGAYGHDVDRFFARYSTDEFSRMLANAGFDVLSLDEHKPETPRPDRQGWLAFLARSADYPPRLARHRE